MAADGTSIVQVQKSFNRFTSVLTSAACEWFLIFFLLVDALLSYLVKQFALYCELQIPCILCSRIDHVFGTEKPGSFCNLLCGNHRSEISSLISCHIHGKLANGYGMCEECLMSFTTKIKTKSDKHKLLTGTRVCSCCKKPLILKQTPKRVEQLKSPICGMTRPNIPLPRRLAHRGNVRNIKDRFSGSGTSHRLVKCAYNPLSHVGCSELNMTSDHESEFLFSDEDETRSFHGSEVAPKSPGRQMLIRHSSAPTLQLDVDSSAADTHTRPVLGEVWKQPYQRMDPSTFPELISLDEFPPAAVQTEKFEAISLPSQNSNQSAISQLMSLVDDPSLFHVVKSSVEPSQRYSDGTIASDSRSTLPNQHEDILRLMTEKSEASKKIREASKEAATRNPGSNEVSTRNLTSGHPNDASNPIVGGECIEASVFVPEQPIMKKPERHNIDLKLFVADENASTTKVGVSANCPIIPLVQSENDGLQLVDALRPRDFHMLQNPVLMDRTHSPSPESLDGNFVSEIEGEITLDRLKRQVEYDRKRINELYEELEQERSASDIAAHQAMAMITRLQEEKAAVHMEALQYLRMMEEQEEYDMEALQKANDLLADREKEIQDLEAELEFFRLKFPEESLAGTINFEICDWNAANMIAENATTHCAEDKGNVPGTSTSTEVLNGSDAGKPIVENATTYCTEDKGNVPGTSTSTEVLNGNDAGKPVLENATTYCTEDKGNVHGTSTSTEVLNESDAGKPVLENATTYCTEDKGNVPGTSTSTEVVNGSDDEKPVLEKSLWSEYEEEKMFISQSLKSLERKLRHFSSKQGASPYTSDSDYSEEMADGGTTREGALDKEGAQANGQVKESNWSKLKHLSRGGKQSKQQKEIDLVTLGNEISDLNERLESLETDRNFFEHTINTLEAGREGLQFVKEIAHQLQELRKIAVRRR
ncbi:hypothetical protein Tsubulata_017713 [Turnera subulata]|uniref:GTD-binding domain-containing protein n=1 Tax=Turnera subulata TaxID=218843 RepID=A0A9Q0GB76_9ROSI|nr:hypothetical protein Tsubulata_017713 [Turnera subulata]